MLMADGTLASVTHLDTLRRHDGGWRISRRVITPQLTPLGGAHLAAESVNLSEAPLGVLY
jgi:hypothetical protein